MKIGIVTSWFERGAGYVSKQYQGLLQPEHEVFIYARGQKTAVGDPIWDTPEVTWDPFGPNDIDLEVFGAWIEDCGIEIIFFNEQRWWPPVFLAREKEIKIGAYIDYYQEETVPCFELYDFLICNTKRHYSVFEWHPQVKYIPWGTDVDLFKPLESRKAPEDPLIFFHSGGYSALSRKGLNHILSALPFLNGTSWKLVIHVQVSFEHKLRPKQKKIFEKFLSSGQIEVIESTVTAPGLYHLGDVYVYPTRLEGIGLSIAEALSMGLPVITTNEGPMNEFIEDGVNGKLVRVEKKYARSDGYYWPLSDVSSDDLAQQMNYYIDRKGNLDDLQKAARKSALDKFIWKNNKSEVLRIFEDTHRRNVNVEEIRPFIPQKGIEFIRRKPAWKRRLIKLIEGI